MRTLSIRSRAARCSLVALSLLVPGVARAQLDLQSWTLVDPYNRWTISHPTPTSCRMDEAAASPTVGPGWVVSPFYLPATASFAVTLQPAANGDDDLIGIAFSYHSNTRFVLLDWKQSTQAFNWGDPVAINDDTAEAGLKLKKAAGAWTRDGLWGGTDGLGVSTLAGPLTPGWVDAAVYTFEFDLTPGRVVIRRNGVQVFDVGDSAIGPGAIAFYAFSQDDVLFSNVTAAPLGPLTYCTTGTSSSGCVPVIAASGTPSIAASSGFTIDVTGLEGGQSGVIFYGVAGRLANPWGMSSSFFCIKAPVERTGVQGSGGSAGQCDGALSVDWLAYVAAHPGAVGAPFSAGATVNAQGWYRDPLAVKTTSLTGGLEFVTQP